MAKTTYLRPQERVRAILQQGPVIPVVTVADIEHAAPITEALLSAGINIIEVTLRTEVALEAIRHIASQYPEITVAAGTVLDAKQMNQVIDAGAPLVVSPGYSDDLIQAATELDAAYLPGAHTISEVMQLRQKKYFCQKFFPANVAGSTDQLKAILSVMPDVSFCPTGGVTLDNMRQYLSLRNVICIGGSWMVPSCLVANEDWAGIQVIAEKTVLAVSQM